MAKKNWETHLSVDRRIVRILSVFTYEDFPRSIREMVSNAYDADATEIRIRIDIDKDVIEVSDDGNGMTPEDFDFFLRIAGQRRANRYSPAFHRNRIGQFGIGFLAVFPFGKRVKIISTARRSRIRFEATIPAERYIQQGAESIDVEDIPITGFQEESAELLEQHGTTIRISGLSNETKRYFRPRHSKRTQKQTIRDWAPYERLRWTLAEDLPIDYAENSPYRNVFGNLPPSGLAVYLNNQELKRNAPGSHILESGTQIFDGAKCQYVIATDWKAIQPVESRYLKQRIRNVGLGERTAFGLQLEGKTYSRLHWLTGEIRILEGFDDLISVDRERFIDSPSYDQFRDFFNKRLSHFALFLETVAEATRDIDRQVKSSRFATVGSKRDIINRNVKKLAGRGFEVVHRPNTTASKKSSPVVVDINRKRVEVVDDHPAFRDVIMLDEIEVPVRYLAWDEKDRAAAPVRRAKDGTVEINISYPLFQSGRYGDLFKRVFLVLFSVAERSEAKNSLVAEVARKLRIEFNDLT